MMTVEIAAHFFDAPIIRHRRNIGLLLIDVGDITLDVPLVSSSSEFRCGGGGGE